MQLFEHLNKRAVIGFGAILVILLAFFFYWLSGSGYGDEGPLSVLPVSPLDASLGRELLVALATLKSTKLDTGVWSDPVYASLKDFGVEISAQPVGRRNPFAELGAATSARGAVKSSAPSGGGKAAPLPSQKKSAPAAEEGGFDIE